MSRAGFCALSLALALSWSCGEPTLDEAEAAQIKRIFASGASLEGDPFVRAETLRVIALLGDPAFAPLARERAEDPSPVVRVAAIRCALALGDPDAPRRALAAYTGADDAERLALLHAALEAGPASLQADLIARALRSSDPDQRAIALERGPLADWERAVRQGDERALRDELVPRFSALVASPHPDVAAAALKALVDSGRRDRAAPLIAKLGAADLGAPERARYARVLRLAGVNEALDLVRPLAEPALAQSDEDAPLALPETADPVLTRAAVLSAAALGDDRFLPAAQAYLKNAPAPEAVEVLRALNRNRSSAATVSVRVAMSDARRPVRRAAIALYGARPDADPKALDRALATSRDPRARRAIADVLIARFPEAWGRALRLRLRAAETRGPTLEALRELFDGTKERAVLAQIRETLGEIVAEAEHPGHAAAAAYLLLIEDPDDDQLAELLRTRSDAATRYVFLEHLIASDPARAVPTFRASLYNDLYAFRLMSAAGLWAAFRPAAAPSEGDARPSP